MVSSKAQRAVAAAVAVGLLGAVAMLTNGDAAQSSLMQMSSMKRSRISMTFLTTGSPSTDSFTFVNTRGGRANQEIELSSLGTKRRVIKTMTFQISDKLGSMICICAKGDDSWRGRLIMFKEDQTEFGGLSGTMKLRKREMSGYYPCQQIIVDPQSKKLINHGLSETCEFPIPRTLGEMAESADESASKLEKLEEESESRGKSISKEMSRITVNFQQGSYSSFRGAVGKNPSLAWERVIGFSRNLGSRGASMRLTTSRMWSSIIRMQNSCQISPDGSTIFSKVGNLAKDVRNCVGAIKNFARSAYNNAKEASYLPSTVSQMHSVIYHLIQSIKGLTRYGDFIRDKLITLTYRFKKLGNQVSSLNTAVEQTQSETASALRGFADDVDELKQDTKETAQNNIELAQKLGLVLKTVAALKESNVRLKNDNAAMAQQIKALSDKVDRLQK